MTEPERVQVNEDLQTESTLDRTADLLKRLLHLPKDEVDRIRRSR
jgi:hypothetical protein